MIKIEHVAYPVQDPPAFADWYVKNLGFVVKRRLDKSPFTHFLADATGHMMLEVYNSPKVTVPDYASYDSLVLHLAFFSDSIDADVQKLIDGGARLEGEILKMPTGDAFAMLRDPWGFAVQLVQRAQPMI